LLDKCSSEVKTDARNDVSHIIEKWFKLLMDEYNIGLDHIYRARNIGWLYNKIKNNHAVQSRVSDIIRGHGMEIEELDMLFTYKFERNEMVHQDSLNRGATALVRSQQLQHALRILHLAPDQPQGFPEAFKKCAEWVYN
jgi:hypothetical protein